ncbi:MAG: magnesium Mg(2+) and cobalt Co(2+) transport protein CorA [Proteobacteria bacterium]|nr:magnesium Mg(2+) and cobalt Co(2+) transport protein CorA [Pseudomonadota bacterium]
MKRFAAKRRPAPTRKTGLPPGSLVHVGEVKTARPEITLMEFDAGDVLERRFTSIAESRQHQPSKATVWLNVYGLHEPEVMAEIGRRFDLHPLVLEDILNTNQRPKIDDYDDYLYLVTHFFDYDAQAMRVSSDQVSMVVGRNFVLTFQERPTGCFDPVRERLRGNKGQIRKLGADYLAYSLLDAVVDRYFVVLDQLSDGVERLEDELLERVTPDVMHAIHHFKRESLTLRRAVWPLREVLNTLQRGEASFFQPETLIYLRDVYDHTVHIIESLDAMRDLMAGMLDMYLSSVSNRLNQEVRVLTVITTLFMPATLISGIFGMNFRVMPWLEAPDGYLFALGLMALVALAMAMIFWRRRWMT